MATELHHGHGQEVNRAHHALDVNHKALASMHDQVHHERLAGHAHPGEKQTSKHLPALDLDGHKHGALDPQRSMDQLMRDGAIKDRRNEATRTHDRPDATPEKEQGRRSIHVEFQDRSHDQHQQQRPDFIVKKDGTIEAHSNPEQAHKGNVVIQVERAEGQLKPTKEQQARLNDLVQYVDSRMNPDSAKDKKPTQIEDAQGLLSDSVRTKITQEKPADEHFDSKTREQVQRMERFNGGGHGHMSRHQADGYFPERSVPRQHNESFQTQDLKDTIAGMFNSDHKHPYDEVRRRSDHSFAVGRYGLNEKLLNSWLSEQLGDPPDMSKLPELMAQLAKQGQIPQDFADKFKDQSFANGFGDFLQRMRGDGAEITSQDMAKFMPKELQETIATNLATRSGKEAGNDAGKAALAWELGRSPATLSDADLNDPQNKSFMDAARRMQSITQARQIAGDRDSIEWNGQAGDLALRLAHDAQSVAQRMGTVGYCYRGVKEALNRIGVHLEGGAAYQARSQLERDPRFREVSLNDLRPGDVLVHPPGYANDGRAHQYGHIAVYLGNNQEASDHVQRLIRGRTSVFRLVENA